MKNWLLAAFFAAGCGGSDFGPTASAMPVGCTPGEQRDCSCQSGANSVQVCESDGASFGQCACGVPATDAGMLGTEGGAVMPDGGTVEAEASVPPCMRATLEQQQAIGLTVCAGGLPMHLYVCDGEAPRDCVRPPQARDNPTFSNYYCCD